MILGLCVTSLMDLVLLLCDLLEKERLFSYMSRSEEASWDVVFSIQLTSELHY